MSNGLFEAVDNAFNEDRITAPVENKVVNEDSIDSSEAIKYVKNLEKSNLNETILSDDQESILSNIINDLTNLQSTIEHEIEDELLTINNKIKEANKIDGVLIDEIEMSSFNQTISTTIEDIKREIRISDMEKEEINESEDLSEAEIPEQLIKNAIELKAIKSRTGKSDYSSEAGRRWNELYKENKSNTSVDLGDSYTASIGYGGDIQISASHPYDDIQYSRAKANISDGRIVSWNVNIPNYGFKDADTTEEALDLVKMADTWIKTGKSTKGYEGITTTGKPKLSFEEFAKQYRDQ